VTVNAQVRRVHPGSVGLGCYLERPEPVPLRKGSPANTNRMVPFGRGATRKVEPCPGRSRFALPARSARPHGPRGFGHIAPQEESDGYDGA